jgi:hypothetical protein
VLFSLLERKCSPLSFENPKRPIYLIIQLRAHSRLMHFASEIDPRSGLQFFILLPHRAVKGGFVSGLLLGETPLR